MSSPEDVTEDLITTPEVAALLGVSPRTVHRRVKSGQLTIVKKLDGPNGPFLFARSSITTATVAA